MSGFVYKLGMDIGEFTKSISEVENELDRLKESLKTATKQGIVETNIQIKELQDSLTNLKKVGLDQLPKGAINGANALFSLGQVARDLPFGFIAIQNNLPQLFDSFSKLSTESKGLLPALKNLGSAFIGPTGLAFAGGLLVSGITTLIQEYGSFGNVIEAIFSKQNKLSKEINKATESYKKFNEELRTSQEISGEESASVSGTISKIQALSNIVLDQTLSYEKRNSALNSLKELNKDYFGNLDLEKTKLEDLKLAIDGYTQSVIQSAITKGFEQEIGNTNVELDKQERLLKKLNAQYNAAKNAPVKIVGIEARVDTRDIIAAKDAYDKQNIVVQSLRNRVQELNSAIDESIKRQNTLKAPIDAANAAIKAQEEAVKANEKAQKKAENLAKKRLNEALKNQKEFSNALKQENEDLKKVEFAYYDLLELRDKLTKGTDFGKKLTESSKVFEKFRKDSKEVNTNLKGPTFVPSQGFINEQNRLKQVQDAFANAKNNLENVFFNPLTDLFSNFFETGKFAFQDFGKVILKTIGQIVSKIIATGIINLLAGILVPGAGLAGVGAAKGIGGAFKAAFNSVLGLGGGKIAAPSFAGIGGGSFGMSGQVNLVLRGQDLVGALNRTNSTINRVG